jgi:archaellum biogenesis ATPase FlaH
MLGGGYLPGSLVMVIGATGIGKTQLGMHFIHQGQADDRARGAIVDLSSRGDLQNHSGYYQRLFDQELSGELTDKLAFDAWDAGRPGDVLPFLGYGGRRVLRSQMDVDQWHSWQSELNRRTPQLFRFIYRHLVSGTRRFVIDGIEPAGGADDSLQLDLVELIYHRMLRQEHDWLAREVLRQAFAAHADQVTQMTYDHRQSVALILVTTSESMLDHLMEQPLASGDLAAGANTIMLMGRRRIGNSVRRGLYIAKHRGSYAEQSIVDFDIQASGLKFAMPVTT